MAAECTTCGAIVKHEPDCPVLLARKADTKPGAYYVTAIEGERVAFLLGPFTNDHARALAAVDEVRRHCVERFHVAHWWAFGTARRDEGDRTGKLNGTLAHLIS